MTDAASSGSQGQKVSPAAILLVPVVVALVMTLFAWPASRQEPQPTGEIGQLLPPGAGGSVVRSTAFFDGAAAGEHLAVLLAWVGVGLLAMVAAAARGRRLAPGADQVMAS